MKLLDPNASPFLVLWYLFIAFFGVAIIVHIFCKIVAAFIDWRLRKLLRTKMTVIVESGSH